MFTFLVSNGSTAVRAEPDLRAAVLGCHGHERHVDDERKGDARVVEIGIVMRGL